MPVGAGLRLRLVSLFALAVFGGAASAEDAVYFSSPNNPQGSVKYTGRILDYTGKELAIQTNGKERRFPGELVSRIESDWTEPHRAADDLFDRREYEDALGQYELAMKSERRRWAQRKIVSQMILCLRNLNQTRRAGDLFLTLLRSDPTTPYFAQIPLTWDTGAPAADLEPQARRWLESDSAAAKLLGASALLSTQQRAAVVKELEELSASKDPRIAALARGLIWNATFAGATENNLRAWSNEVETFPPALQAGPYFVLGKALAQQKHPEDAALVFLRAPTLYALDRPLAASALFQAARALEQSEHPAEAAILYAELLAEYPKSSSVSEARDRLKEITGQTPAAQLTAGVIASTLPLTAANVDERFLEGLRQRNLFRLAEKFCRDRLARKELPELARTELTIELSRTLVDEALQATGEARDELWRQASGVAAELLKAASANPRSTQLRVQLGLVQLAWGELLRQEAETTGGSEQALSQAREHLRLAIDSLRDASAATADALRAQQLGRKPAPGEWSGAELRALDKNTQYQTARALRSLAESYPPESADRTGALTQAVDLLAPLSQLDVEDPLGWPSRLDAAACHRLLGNLDSAKRRLDLIDQQSPPEQVAARALAERLRLSVAEKRIEAATQLLNKWRTENHAPLAELDYAALELLLAAWQTSLDAGDKTAATEGQKRAADAATEIQRTHGAYWGRRAEALLAERLAGKMDAAGSAALARAAEGFYRAGQRDEAVTAYDRAATEARKAAQLAQAFDWQYTAAAIEQEQKHFAVAADRFREAAIAQPKLAKAADAHLLAIYNWGQHAQTDKAPTAIARYTELLEEHLAKWPDALSADRARVWLGRVRDREGHWPAAAEQYAAVRPTSEAAGEALEGLARAQQAALAQLRSADKPTEQAAAAAIAQIERLAGAQGVADAPTNDAQRQALLAAAQILLEYTTGGAAQAEKLVQAALANSADAPAEWKLSAQGVLLCALAAQDRVVEAAAQIAPLAEADPRELLPLIDSLERQLETAAAPLRRNLATLELKLIDLALRPSAEDSSVEKTSEHRATKLDAEQLQKLALLRGRVLILSGRPEDGIAELRRLATANPKDGQAQEALARAQFDTGADEALAAWQGIETKSRPGGARWLRAKYYQALIAERRGDKQRAAQMVKLLQLRYPALGGAEQKEQFEQLRKRCEAK